ncbi:hypothetical protein LPJ53_003563 [Coemansia erecta]|uniref:DUF3533 domain-containing protein n=1 Tax=Coemansia erecta TaxID=147472 RepID=A0A9W8CQ34_9FUNG|nr:hypothetical protein LPJ53_003563 [Coemansia erecta]
MVKEHTSFSTALPVFAESSPAHRIAETAIDFIWKLGLEHPESGLVPEDDYDRIRMLQFLYIWAAKVVPLLCKRGRIRSGCPDLATLSSWIALQRRRHTKRRGAFWNGRIPSAVEIAVAPLADTLLHSGIIPDTPEYSSLSTVHANNLDIYVIDLDGGYLGSNVTRMVMDIEVTPATPLWYQKSGFDTVADAKDWVRKNAWGALVINPGASSRLDDALNNGADYDATDALTLIPSSGRHPVAEMLFVDSALTNAAYAVNQKFALAQIDAYKEVQADSRQINYNALFNPILSKTTDASPAGFSNAAVLTTFATLTCVLCTIAFLIMWKLTSFSFFQRVRFCDLYPMWLVLLLGLALGLSLNISFAILAFRGPDYNELALTYTGATFFKLWFTFAAEALALGLWLFNWFLFLPPHFLAWPSIATVITDVVSCMGCPELAPKFYSIMYATPAYNAGHIAMYVISGAYPENGKLAGILVAEIVATGLALGGSIWLRQFFVLRGISDTHGFYRGSTYFHSTVPYYKDKDAAPDHDGSHVIKSGRLDNESTLSPGRRHRPSSDIDITDCDSDNVSLRAGDLGV